MTNKFKVYLVNGTEQTVYNLTARGNVYTGFSDEACTKKIVPLTREEVHMYDGVRDLQTEVSEPTSDEVNEDNEEDLANFIFTYLFSCDRRKDPSDYLNQEIYESVTKNNGNVAGFGYVDELKHPSYIRLPMADDEYAELNALLDHAGIDIDDTRAIAVFLLRMAGIRVLKE